MSVLEPLIRDHPEARVALVAPEVGLWREPPTVGQLLQPGESLGRIETLGLLRRLVVPRAAAGLVVERFDDGRARSAVDRATVLVVLDPNAAGRLGAAAQATETEAATSGFVVPAPMAGRLYLRPAPGKPPFVAVGQRVEENQTVALLEVMKTFNRVVYAGRGLPASARVKAILCPDESDVDAGRPLIEVEPD